MADPRGIVERLLCWLIRPDPTARRDATPADGRVELVGWPRGAATPNMADDRLARLDPVAEAAAVPVATRAARHRPPLLGRVVLGSFFVGRDGVSWSDAEVARAYRALERAATWIEREAARWRAAVNVDLGAAYVQADDDDAEPVEIDFQQEGDGVGPLEAHAVTRNLASASRAAARLGFADVAELIARLSLQAPGDQVVWLLHMRRGGRSLAIPQEDSGLPGVDIAVCYARETSFPEPLVGVPFSDPITFVHELLHLFGASDKYGQPLARYPRGSVTDRDIMRLDHNRLARMCVDPCTAREIGWLHGS